MKKIGINALYLIPKKVGGTEYLLRSFLTEIEKQDQENRYVVFCNKNNFGTFEFESERFKKVLVPVNAENRVARILLEQIYLPWLVRKECCDLLHSFGYFGPIFNPGYSHIVTVHDVNWRDHPEDMSFLTLLMSKFLIEANLNTADKIITDSNFSKGRLLKHFPWIKSKLKVVWPGVDDLFLNLLKKKTQPIVSGKYYLLVSAFYPHKKVAQFLSFWNKSSIKEKLVIIGDRGLEKNKVRKLASQNKNIILLKKVNFSDLVCYYQHAKGFIAPSIYEGFGFPVYEASAVGLPIWVGKKELYSKILQESLLPLGDFFQDKDDKLGRRIILSYQQSTKKLIKIYENFGS